MRPHAVLALTLLASACGLPPTISFKSEPVPRLNTPLTITAVVTWPDGSPFRGAVDFAATDGRVWPERVKANDKGIANTTVTVDQPGPVVILATAPGVAESLSLFFPDPRGLLDRPNPPPSTPPRPGLVFRTGPAEVQINNELRPVPVVAIELLDANGHPVFEQYDGPAVPVTLAVTSCAATIDPQSQLTVTTFARLAIFNGLLFTTPATGCVLTASSPGLFPASQRLEVLP